jgi:hypothetical protein
MSSIKIIDVYPVTLKGHRIECPADHMIKSIEFELSNIDNQLENNETLLEWLKYMPHLNDVPNIKEYDPVNNFV